MRIEKRILESAISLYQSVASVSLPFKNEVLNQLVLVIQEGTLYLLAQGEGLGTSFRVLKPLYTFPLLGDEEYVLGDAEYVLDGSKLLKVLREVDEDEVDLLFNSQSLTVSSRFGKVKLLSHAGLLSSSFENEENLKFILKDTLEVKELTLDGLTVPSSQWKSVLHLLNASTSDVVGNAVLGFGLTHSWLSIPYLQIKSDTSFEFTRPLGMPLDVAKVFGKVVGEGDSRVLLRSNGRTFSYVEGDTVFMVTGLPLVVEPSDESDDESPISVNVRELQRLIRVSSIFLEDKFEDVNLLWDYDNRSLTVQNIGVGEFGASVFTPLTLHSELDGSVKTTVFGEALYRVLSLTDDETVSVAVLNEPVKALRLSYTGGSAKLVYI